VNKTVNCSVFNATVRLQGQQYLLVDSDNIYFFIFVFKNLLDDSWDCGGRAPSGERWWAPVFAGYFFCEELRHFK